MSFVPIPNLPAAINLTGAEMLEAVQAGTSVRITTGQIATQFFEPVSITFANIADLRSTSYKIVGAAAVEGTQGGLFYVNTSDTSTGWTGTASISGNTLTAHTTISGALAIGLQIANNGAIPAWITAGSGTTWTLNGGSQAVGTGPMTADNGVTIFVDLAGDRWQRFLTGPLTLAQAGAVDNPAADQTTPVQAEFTYAATLNGGSTISGAGLGRVKLNGPLTLDTNKVGFDMSGLVVDASGLPTNGTWLTVLQSNTDVNARGALNKAHPIARGVVNGPSNGSVTGTVGVLLVDNFAGFPTIDGVTFKDGGSSGFNIQFRLSTGSFFTTWDNWDFGATSIASSDVCIDITGATNAGEKTTILNSRFGNGTTAIRQANGNADTMVVATSFDSMTGTYIILTFGSMHFDVCHFEANNDLSNIITVANTSTVCQLVGGTIILDVARSNFSPFDCAASVTNGGLSIRDMNLGLNGALNVPLVSGTGVVKCKGLMDFANNSFYVGPGANLLAYGDFESANYTAEWVFSGTTPPARSNVSPISGTWSLAFQGLNGQTNSGYSQVLCTPGDYFCGFFKINLSGITGGGTFAVTGGYVDAGGNSVGTPSVLVSLAANTATASHIFRMNFPAPIGARGARLTGAFFSVTSGTPIGLLDDIVLNVT